MEEYVYLHNVPQGLTVENIVAPKQSHEVVKNMIRELFLAATDMKSPMLADYRYKRWQQK